ncbi:uncharacterized protein LOC105631359 [Jatropha curcas]|uniref:uncharacterized protein LOC105631359 n=1 Tax=Jatropha curcas TaxID=180498 RepID=UPI001894C3B0|nr:uncharacterized protein LOC105631359 [Jatropha curcas]
MMGFNFINCFRLGNGNATTIAVELLRQLIRKVPSHFFAEFTIIVPGNRIPVWSDFESRGSSVRISVPGDFYWNYFRGFAFWAVLEVNYDHDSLAISNNDPTMQMQFCLEFYLMHKNKKLISDTGIVLNRSYEIKGDHVWLRFIPSCTLKLIRG